MKNWFRSLILFICINLSSFVAPAAEKEYLDDTIISDFAPEAYYVNPFSLSSILLSTTSYDYKVVEEATGNKMFTPNGTLRNLTITLDKPVHKYISYGLNFSSNTGLSPNFSGVSSDTTLSLRLQYPIKLESMGDVAFYIKGGLGISAFLLGNSGTPSDDNLRNLGQAMEYDHFLAVKKIEFRLGAVKTLGYGN